MWPQNWFHPAITVLRRYQFVCHTAVIQPLPKTQKADLKNPAYHSWPDFQTGANKSTASIFFTKKDSVEVRFVCRVLSIDKSWPYYVFAGRDDRADWGDERCPNTLWVVQTFVSVLCLCSNKIQVFQTCVSPAVLVFKHSLSVSTSACAHREHCWLKEVSVSCLLKTHICPKYLNRVLATTPLCNCVSLIAF